jgi:hypothetical protein
MIAFLPPIVAAGAVMIALLCTSPNRFHANRNSRPNPGSMSWSDGGHNEPFVLSHRIDLPIGA